MERGKAERRERGRKGMGEQRRWQVGPRHQRLREKVRAPVGLAGLRAVRGEQAERAVRAGEKVNKAGRRAQGLAGQARWGLGWLKG